MCLTCDTEAEVGIDPCCDKCQRLALEVFQACRRLREGFIMAELTRVAPRTPTPTPVLAPMPSPAESVSWADLAEQEDEKRGR